MAAPYKVIRPEGYHEWKAQKNNAKFRKIDWNLDYLEWITWWLNTGHWHERGKHGDEYSMCRFGDTGPYEIGNIYCATHNTNIQHAMCGKKKSADHTAKLRIILDRVRPPRRKVETKDGVFNSIMEAAEFYNMSSAGIVGRCKKPKNHYSEWKFV